MALKAGERMESGFVRDEDGRLVAVAEGSETNAGFITDKDGRVVLAGSPGFSPVTTGEGAPARFGKGLLYFQMEGTKAIALWEGQGTGADAIQREDLTGAPADGSVTAAKVAAANIDGAAGTPSMRSLDTDTTLAANSDTRVPSQKAVKAFVETLTTIAEGAITAAKLAVGAVTEEKLAGESVATSKIKAGAVSAAKLGAEAVEAAKIKAGAVSEEKLAEAVKNKLLSLVAPTALAVKAEKTESEPSASKATIVTGHFEGASATRTKLKILVSGTLVAEPAISVTSSGVTAVPFCFVVPAGSKWQWEKVEGTVEGFKFSNVVL